MILTEIVAEGCQVRRAESFYLLKGNQLSISRFARRVLLELLFYREVECRYDIATGAQGHGMAWFAENTRLTVASAPAPTIWGTCTDGECHYNIILSPHKLQ